MASFGQETYQKVGSGITVTADGAPTAKVAGVTIAWDEIVAATADAVYKEYDHVYTGEKFLRYGTILCRIATGTNVGKYLPYGMTPAGGGTLAAAARGNWYILNESVHENDYASDHPPVIDGGRVFSSRLDVEDLGAVGNETQTITLGAGNSGGDFTITFSGQTTSAIAYNATGGTVQTAMEALSNVAPGDVTVTGAAGGPYTFVFAGVYADTNVPAMTTTPSLTGGANTATVATTVTTGPPRADFETAFPQISYV